MYRSERSPISSRTFAVRSAAVIDFRSVIKPFREHTEWRARRIYLEGVLKLTTNPRAFHVEQDHRFFRPQITFSPPFSVYLAEVCPGKVPWVFSEEKSPFSFSRSTLVVVGVPRARLPIDHPAHILFLPLSAMEIAANPKRTPSFDWIHRSKQPVFVENPRKTVGPAPTTLWPAFIVQAKPR